MTDKADRLEEPTDEEISENILKLRERFGDSRTGGKGTQRRKNKVVAKPTTSGNKVMKGIVKEIGAQPFKLEEANLFRDDSTILHFENPEGYAAVRSNIFIVSGNPQTKTIKELLPGVIKQLGPKQQKALQQLVMEQTTSDDVPDLAPNTAEGLQKVD